jgi:hypothetical protein
MAVANLSSDLPWQGLQAGANALSGLGANPQDALAQLGPMYSQQYNAALNMNQALFNAGQSGYQNLRNQLDQQFSGIQQGYNDLYGNVQGMIQGSNASNIQDINTNYAAQAGQASSDMVSRGLGNSTVQQNMQRAINLDRARAITQSQNQFAQLGANYAAQIGGAGLAAQQQGAGIQASLGQAQMNALNQVNAGYPDASMYGQLAAMYGAQQQRQQYLDNIKAQNILHPQQIQGGAGVVNRQPSPFGSKTPMSLPAGYGDFGGGSVYTPMSYSGQQGFVAPQSATYDWSQQDYSQPDPMMALTGGMGIGAAQADPYGSSMIYGNVTSGPTFQYDPTLNPGYSGGGDYMAPDMYGYYDGFFSGE